MRLIFSIVSTATAQEERVNDGLIKRGKSRVDYLLDKYVKVRMDTNYVARPATPWTIRVFSTMLGNHIQLIGHNAADEYIASKLDADYKTTMGMSFNYRGLALSLSFNPAKLLGKNSNTTYHLNYYNNRYGADVTLSNVKQLKATSDINGQIVVTDLNQVIYRYLDANVYYVFGRRKFSYPAAFTHSWIQKRSAGAFLATSSFYYGRLHSNYVDASGRLPKDKRINMMHLTLGGGYAYNYVPNRHWLLHLSAMPSLMLLSKYDYNMEMDANTGEGIKKDFPSPFPRFHMVGRTGFVYNWSRYFAGMTGVVQFTKVGKNQSISLKNTDWYGKAFLGIRL